MSEDLTRGMKVPGIPAGTVGVVGGDLARYQRFSLSMSNLIIPEGTRYVWTNSHSVVDNGNAVFRSIGGDWAMIMGDDHDFEAGFLIRLLRTMYERDLDVIFPLCLSRHFPFRPVLYTSREADGYISIDLDNLPESGDMVVEVRAGGSAGMIVRRRVVDAIGEPWFRYNTVETTTDLPFQLAEDLDFCDRVLEHGFRMWADLEVHLGHCFSARVWPSHDGFESGAKIIHGYDTEVFFPRSILEGSAGPDGDPEGADEVPYPKPILEEVGKSGKDLP